MFWDAKGIKRFTSNDVGGDAGDSAKINICDVCHRRPARQIFVTGCKDSYKSQRTSRMVCNSQPRLVVPGHDFAAQVLQKSAPNPAFFLCFVMRVAYEDDQCKTAVNTQAAVLLLSYRGGTVLEPCPAL